MRYFIKLQYDGSNHHGWQSQPTEIPTIQGDIEKAFSKILREKIEVVGCGRTDTGVHARDYYMHMDLDHLDWKLFGRVNRLVSDNIALLNFKAVTDDAHARFDASSRSYEYHIHFQKNPFISGRSFLFPYKSYDRKKMKEAVAMLTEYTHFDTFCKSNTDVIEKVCEITRSEWVFNEDGAVYYVSANRFLRGMIRLIVGMSLQVARGQMELEYVKQQLSNQERLEKALSAPAHGLYLCDIKYPFID
jgi:tRNA pseudouridine38-40 synthase